MRFVFRLEVRGLDNLPDCRFVITPNHVSYLDPPAVAAALPWQRLRVTFGQPVDVDELNRERDEQEPHEQIAAALRDAVASLTNVAWPEKVARARRGDRREWHCRP